MFANGARKVAQHGEEWIVLHGGSGGGAANVCRVDALALEFRNQADPAKRQQRKQPEDTRGDDKPMDQNTPLSFRPVQKMARRETRLAMTRQSVHNGMRFSNGRGSGRAEISLTRSAS